MRIIGIILLVAGILAMVYQGITYTSQETVLNVGPVEVTAQEKKSIPLPPVLGAIGIVAGITLILVDRRKSQLSL